MRIEMIGLGNVVYSPVVHVTILLLVGYIA